MWPFLSGYAYVETNTENKGQERRGDGLRMRYSWIFVTGSNPFYFVFKAVLFLQMSVRKMNP